jgi:methionyl-tRNA synthetase
VTVTPPTPNGDLHLGHLAGPYLSADVFARAQRMLGRQVHYVTGSDDYQSYVAGKGLRTAQDPEQVADHYAARIVEALRLAGVRCDQFTRTLRPDYVVQIQQMVARLYEQGHVVAQDFDYLVAPDHERALFEFYVSGRCPHCLAAAGGGCCEECGRLNEGSALIDAAATLTSQPDQALRRRRVRRLVLPLSRHAQRVRELVDQIPMSTHLRSLAESLLAEGLPDVPVTHPDQPNGPDQPDQPDQSRGWGLACTVPGFTDQVVSSWFEMSHSLRVGIEQCGATAAQRPEVVQFFGFDNGFYYALLYPLLSELVDPGAEPVTALLCNEFYLLDGLKFSTSRNHAVWVREILQTESADLVRFYLAYTSPTVARTSFSTDVYQAFVTEQLRGCWQSWLHDLGRRVEKQFAGRAPEAGLWSDRQHCCYRDLDGLLQRLRGGYQATTFSPQAVTRMLIELVRCAREFAIGEHALAALPQRRDEYRTAIALELAMVRALAQHVAPIMPDVARRLWRGLGFDGEVEVHGFGAQVSWVPAGHSIDLGGDLFSAAIETNA